MRPMLVTMSFGETRRLNPMQIMGWKEADVPLEGGKVVLGSQLILPGGPIDVLESAGQLDWMFEMATTPSGPSVRMGAPQGPFEPSGG